jgi:hypothetical protein
MSCIQQAKDGFRRAKRDRIAGRLLSPLPSGHGAPLGHPGMTMWESWGYDIGARLSMPPDS